MTAAKEFGVVVYIKANRWERALMVASIRIQKTLEILSAYDAHEDAKAKAEKAKQK